MTDRDDQLSQIEVEFLSRIKKMSDDEAAAFERAVDESVTATKQFIDKFSVIVGGLNAGNSSKPDISNSGSAGTPAVSGATDIAK